MRTKKSEQANLEKHKVTFRQIGIILTLGLLFIAFEYTHADLANPDYKHDTEVAVEMEYVPITREKQVALPPPPTLIIDRLIIDIFNDSPQEKIAIINEIDPADEILFVFPEDIEEDPDKVWISTDIMPRFPGGVNALMNYLSEHIVYPNLAQEMGIQGRVYVQFVVNKKGEIINLKILKGVDQSLDAEALRVVREMPRWEAGSQSGKNVNVSFNLPINFKLK